MSYIFKWSPIVTCTALGITTTVMPVVSHSKIFVSVEQAQKLMFGQTVLTASPIVLNEETRKQMKDASSVSHPFDSTRMWRSDKGEWFIVDEVVGKHEMITYAVGINADGSVKQIEILEYRESYGHEVAQIEWLNQFVGKTAESTIKLNKDVQNISGATLSAKHLTDGVKRVLVMYDLALKKNSQS